MKIKQTSILWCIIVALLLVLVSVCYVLIPRTNLLQSYQEYKRKHHNYPPYSTSVQIDSTNLPVIYMWTNDVIERDDYVSAKVKIVDKGEVSYEGYMAIRYRGHASFTKANKKSYAIRPLEAPLEEGGIKTGASLLGMAKDKKWVLKAYWNDRSMMREAIAYSLSRHYSVGTPDMRFCELVINDVYYGVYALMEQPTRKRLDLEKIKNGLTGGYVLYFSRSKDADLLVNYESDGRNIIYPFQVKYPDIVEMNKDRYEYLSNRIIEMTKAISDTTSTEYENFIDVQSFIDYQLSSEFTHNTDSYWCSGYMYKDEDEIDGRFKMYLWDGDFSFGMCKEPRYSDYDNWVYEGVFPIDQLRQGQHFFNWWTILMKNPVYKKAVAERWQECRKEFYSNEYIEHTVDSLASLLEVGGAVERNNSAWFFWGEKGSIRDHPDIKYFSSSHSDEVRYIKDYIKKRLEWMDNELDND